MHKANFMNKSTQGKKVAIVQSNYIPWKGYFDLINFADEFVLYDDAQYTKRDWRNRNKIKTPNGSIWLTIPVEVKGKFYQKIKETKTVDNKWRKKHWTAITLNYSKAKYFKDYKDIFEQLYLADNERLLSRINFKFIKAINDILGIKTKIRWSEEFRLTGNKSEKLLSICKALEANVYVSGPKAKNYLDEELFAQEGIKVLWFDFTGYKEYSQLFTPPFDHYVSVIDLIFNEGKNAVKFMKTFENQASR